MNTETSYDVLLTKLCRLTALDKVALTFGAMFLFGALAFAALAYVAIGDAPQDRMWSFLLDYSALGFAVTILAPWAACRSVHAAGHAGRIAWKRRAARTPVMQPLGAFRTA